MARTPFTAHRMLRSRPVNIRVRPGITVGPPRGARNQANVPGVRQRRRARRGRARPAARGRRPSGLGTPGGRRGEKTLGLTPPEPAETDDRRAVLAHGHGAASLPLHHGRGADADQTRHRGLAEGEATSELLDETGRQSRHARLVLGHRGLPSATRVRLLPARRYVPERGKLRAKLPHRLAQPTHVPSKRRRGAPNVLPRAARDRVLYRHLDLGQVRLLRILEFGPNDRRARRVDASSGGGPCQTDGRGGTSSAPSRTTRARIGDRGGAIDARDDHGQRWDGRVLRRAPRSRGRGSDVRRARRSPRRDPGERARRAVAPRRRLHGSGAGHRRSGRGWRGRPRPLLRQGVRHGERGGAGAAGGRDPTR